MKRVRKNFEEEAVTEEDNMKDSQGDTRTMKKRKGMGKVVKSEDEARSSRQKERKKKANRWERKLHAREMESVRRVQKKVQERQLSLEQKQKKAKKMEGNKEKIDKQEEECKSSIVLAEVAYDLSRSGTTEQMSDIQSAVKYLIRPPSSTSSSLSRVSCERALQNALFFSKAAFLLALSGVNLRSPLHDSLSPGDLPSCVIDAELSSGLLLTVLDALVLNAATSLSSAHSTDSSKESIENICANLLQILDHFALAGLGVNEHAHMSGFDILRRSVKSFLSSISVFPKILSSHVALERFMTGPAEHMRLEHWMHSPCGSPLTSLWMHSAKQKKVRVVSKTANALPPGIRAAKLVETRGRDCSIDSNRRYLWGGDSPLGFLDPELPLVVDVGCGFGVSLLGLAAMQLQESQQMNIKRKYNYIGCDLSSHCIAYASGIAKQWQIDGSCRFCVAPAEDFLGWILSRDGYKGPVAWVSVQFPTPFKYTSTINTSKDSPKQRQGKNSQLPLDESAEEEGFMVTTRVLELCAQIATQRGDSCCNGQNLCAVYFQSNVEDVLVTLRHRFEEVLASRSTLLKRKRKDAKDVTRGTYYLDAFLASQWVGFPREVFDADSDTALSGAITLSQELSDDNLPRRQEQWIAAGGERADPAGGVYLASSPLPSFGATETEVAYRAMRKPVHRVAWQVVAIECRYALFHGRSIIEFSVLAPFQL